MPDKRPNILWIMSEQTNANCIGCYGSPDVKTPNIDALAGGGVRFERAYATNPTCMPSRFSYLSGMYPHSHGIGANHSEACPDPALALTRALAEQAGYSTGFAGKTHIGRWEDQVFDVGFPSTGSPNRNGYREYLEENDLTKLVKPVTAEEHIHYDMHQTELPYEHSQPVWTANTAMRVMDELKDPFFMWVSFDKPHGPFTLPKDPPVTYDPRDLSLPPGSSRSFHLKPFSQRLGIENMWDIETTGEGPFLRALAAYYTLISMVDDNIGRLMKHLDERGILENTIVIYCADHGDFGGEHGQIGKNALGGYEQIYRVPMVWSWKGQFGREVVRGLVENVDFFPTVCDLVGVEPPASVQGESYAHALRMSAGNCGYKQFQGKEAVFFEASSLTRTVRTTTHKLTYRYDGAEQGEMYDLTRDPMETVNLFDLPECAPLRERLLRKLLNQMIRTEQPRTFSECDQPAPPWRWFQKNFAEASETPRDRKRID